MNFKDNINIINQNLAVGLKLMITCLLVIVVIILIYLFYVEIGAEFDKEY